MNWQITVVTPLDNYQLLLEFKNGEQKLFDVKPYLELGRFQELKQVELFSMVKVSFDTITWENGLDLDPEMLFEESVIIEKSIE